MWTYKVPYKPEEFSRKYLEDKGRLALSRALNVGRVIAFVSSGATTVYGRQSWNELAKTAAKNAVELASKADLRSKNHRFASHDTLDRFAKDGVGDNAHIIGMAARLAADVGESKEFRRQLGEFYYGKRPSYQDRAVCAEIPSRAEPLRTLISDLRISRLLTTNYDCEIEEEFRRLYRTSGSADYRHRYDTEISPFDILCQHDLGDGTDGSLSAAERTQKKKEHYEEALKLPGKIEYADGTSRSVLSVSMNSENIGDLINFALQPRQYVGQVFHLHGRCDKPNDMVLTDADYRDTYLKSDEQAQTFDEALSALMTGNDILFVGSGMSEQDILRPLRQFASQDRTPDFANRHVFAMLENKVTLDTDWLRNSDGADRTRDDFLKNHIGHVGSAIEDFDAAGSLKKDKDAEESEAVKLRAEFGVYSLYHGGTELRIFRMLDMLVKEGKGVGEGNKRSPFSERARKYDGNAFMAALEAIRSSIEQLITSAPDTHAQGDPIPPELFLKAELTVVLKKIDAMKNALRLGTQPKQVPKGTEKFFANLASEARSRALDRALRCAEQGRKSWWKDWSRAPRKRQSSYQSRYIENDAEEKTPSFSRHRPVYHAPNKDVSDELEPLKELRELGGEVKKAQEQDIKEVIAKVTRSIGPWTTPGCPDRAGFDTNAIHGLERIIEKRVHRDFLKVPPRRILRASMARGHGKGSLLHVLQQEIQGKKDRLYLDTLFDGDAGTDASFRYHGSVSLHLSFSMEFSSVIAAVRKFVRSSIANAVSEHPMDLVKVLQGTFETNGRSFAEYVCSHRGLQSKLETFCNDLVKVTEPEETLKVRKDFLADFDEEILDPFLEKVQREQNSTRLHRLDELRLWIDAYTDLIDMLHDKNLRLLITMCGIDKLCDDDGVAYNPMFRAFFRLLTGCGAKHQTESDFTAPIDIFLLSGKPNLPTRYLSEEFSVQATRQKLQRSEEYSDDLYSSYNEYRVLDSEKHLKYWPQLSPIGLLQRYWFANRDGEKDDKEFYGFQCFAAEVAKSSKECDDESRANFARICQNGVAVTSWCAGAYAATMGGYKRGKVDEKRGKVDEFIKAFSSAGTRGENAMILREVLEFHKIQLRAWGERLNKDLERESQDFDIRDSSKWDGLRNWPSVALRKERKNAEDPNTEEANRMVDLTYLVLSHLALFPMPVEPRVLYGCDEIHELLTRLCQPKIDPGELKGQPPALLRKRRLRLLNQLLEYLHKSCLIIAVEPKLPGMDKSTPGNGTLDVGGDHPTDFDFHCRFTVQNQLRDFAARLMDFSVPDQGERNFFQVSIYCDQPRDLPAPREEHYRLVRDIMDRQIGSCRDTLWCLTQLQLDHKAGGNAYKLQGLPEHSKNLATEGLRQRLTDLSGADFGKPMFDDKLPSVHAVPQRIRALYGLIRSGFSVATISRLSSHQEPDLDRPYERFRGWLRGITNAAIGWDHLLNGKREDVSLSGDFFDRAKDAMETIKGFDTSNFNNVPRNVDVALPLYQDEIGWLLNERGLLSLVQGQVFDAIPLFKRALEVMYHDDIKRNQDPALHAAVRRVRFNMAIALIDRGHLSRARTMLSDLKLSSEFSSHSGSQISWLAQGYIGLVDHLSGNFQSAATAYQGVTEKAQRRGMTRVVAVFSKHWADLQRRDGDIKDARRLINISIAAATQGAQRDVQHLALISEGLISLEERSGGDGEIGSVVNNAMHFAQSMGIPRLECEALNLKSTLMLSQGERMLAGAFAARAAAIANRNGLRLTKLRALQLYGFAVMRRSQLGLSAQVLEETRREAERRGYQSLALSLSKQTTE